MQLVVVRPVARRLARRVGVPPLLRWHERGEQLCTRDVDASRLALSSARLDAHSARDMRRLYQDIQGLHIPGYTRIYQRDCAVRLERMRMHGNCPYLNLCTVVLVLAVLSTPLYPYPQ